MDINFLVILMSLSSIIIDFGETLSCLDEHGKSVDYLIGYKIPKLEKSKDELVKNGLKYVYATSRSSSSWISSIRSINDLKSVLGATLKPILETKSNYNLIVYNDQKPTIRTRGSSSGAHAKGILATYGKTGFWLIHSIPQFPVLDSKYEYPKRSLNNGQAFICITISTDDNQTIENIRQYLHLIKPQYYSFNLTKSFLEKNPLYQDLISKKRGSGSRGKNSKELISSIHSNDKVKFVTFAKSKNFNNDIYAKIIAPYFQEDFLVQTWRNGAGEMQPSDCKERYQIINVNSMKMNNNQWQWKFSEDHAKWAITTKQSPKAMICLSDINRMKSQFSRGGGAICLQSKNLWNLFKSSINDVDGCPTNKVKYPTFNWIQKVSSRFWKKIDDVKQKCSRKLG